MKYVEKAKNQVGGKWNKMKKKTHTHTHVLTTLPRLPHPSILTRADSALRQDKKQAKAWPAFLFIPLYLLKHTNRYHKTARHV